MAAPVPDPGAPDPNLDEGTLEIIERTRELTMTTWPRLAALVDAVRHCERRGIEGAFAECGVWRGGSVLAMILALQQLDVDDRDIHLYDTFTGMTTPTEHDTSAYGGSADELSPESGSEGWRLVFGPDSFSEEGVRELLTSTGYPAERLHFAAGPVEDTIPRAAPEQLALLRLDTDWYESTRHELTHLYPRLERGGILIIDDYGHWDGARRAVDEYFGDQADPPLLARVDYTARIAVRA